MGKKGSLKMERRETESWEERGNVGDGKQQTIERLRKQRENRQKLAAVKVQNKDGSSLER